MTKSTITREQLEEWVAQFDEDGGCDATDSQLEALIRQSLAAMDGEPDRNPVLAYADSYRDMAKQGVESVPIWSVITDLERNIAPLYRHAQPAPVAPVCTCPSGDGSLRWPCPVHPGNCPVIPDGWKMVPIDATRAMIDAARRVEEDGYDAMHKAMLAAAPQPQNAPQNIPEIIPDCWCRTCRPVGLNDMRFVVCPDCGNKRCPPGK